MENKTPLELARQLIDQGRYNIGKRDDTALSLATLAQASAIVALVETLQSQGSTQLFLDQIQFLEKKLETTCGQTGNALRRYDALSDLLEQYAGRSLSHDEKVETLQTLIQERAAQ